MSCFEETTNCVIVCILMECGLFWACQCLKDINSVPRRSQCSSSGAEDQNKLFEANYFFVMVVSLHMVVQDIMTYRTLRGQVLFVNTSRSLKLLIQ